MKKQSYLFQKFQKKYLFFQRSFFDFFYWRSTNTFLNKKNLNFQKSHVENQFNPFEQEKISLLQRQTKIKKTFENFQKSNKVFKKNNFFPLSLNQSKNFSFDSKKKIRLQFLVASKQPMRTPLPRFAMEQHTQDFPNLRSSPQPLWGRGKAAKLGGQKLMIEGKQQKKVKNSKYFQSKDSLFLYNQTKTSSFELFRSHSHTQQGLGTTNIPSFGTSKIGNFFPKKKHFQQYWIFPFLGVFVFFSQNSSMLLLPLGESNASIATNPFPVGAGAEESFEGKRGEARGISVHKLAHGESNPMRKRVACLLSAQAKLLPYRETEVSFPGKDSKKLVQAFQTYEKNEFLEFLQFSTKIFQNSIPLFPFQQNENHFFQKMFMQKFLLQKNFVEKIETKRNTFNWTYFSVNSVPSTFPFSEGVQASLFGMQKTNLFSPLLNGKNKLPQKAEFFFEMPSFLEHEKFSKQNTQSFVEKRKMFSTPIFEFSKNLSLIDEYQRKTSFFKQSFLQKDDFLFLNSFFSNSQKKEKTKNFLFSPIFQKNLGFDSETFFSFFVGNKKNFLDSEKTIFFLKNWGKTQKFWTLQPKTENSFMVASAEKNKEDLSSFYVNKRNLHVRKLFPSASHPQLPLWNNPKELGSSPHPHPHREARAAKLSPTGPAAHLFPVGDRELVGSKACIASLAQKPTNLFHKKTIKNKNFLNLDAIYLKKFFKKLVKNTNQIQTSEFDSFQNFSKNFLLDSSKKEKIFLNFKKQTFDFFIFKSYHLKYKKLKNFQQTFQKNALLLSVHKLAHPIAQDIPFVAYASLPFTLADASNGGEAFPTEQPFVRAGAGAGVASKSFPQPFWAAKLFPLGAGKLSPTGLAAGVGGKLVQENQRKPFLFIHPILLDHSKYRYPERRDKFFGDVFFHTEKNFNVFPQNFSAQACVRSQATETKNNLFSSVNVFDFSKKNENLSFESKFKKESTLGKKKTDFCFHISNLTFLEKVSAKFFEKFTKSFVSNFHFFEKFQESFIFLRTRAEQPTQFEKPFLYCKTVKSPNIWVNPVHGSFPGKGVEVNQNSKTFYNVFSPLAGKNQNTEFQTSDAIFSLKYKKDLTSSFQKTHPHLKNKIQKKNLKREFFSNFHESPRKFEKVFRTFFSPLQIENTNFSSNPRFEANPAQGKSASHRSLASNASGCGRGVGSIQKQIQFSKDHICLKSFSNLLKQNSKNQNLSFFVLKKQKHLKTNFATPQNAGASHKKTIAERTQNENANSFQEGFKILRTKNHLSPELQLKRDGFVFFGSKNPSLVSSDQSTKNQTFLRFEKEKFLQKKRRLKKEKLETRRRKKRKRFFPRPTWLRMNLYKKFLKTRHSQKAFFSFSKLHSSPYPLPLRGWGRGEFRRQASGIINKNLFLQQKKSEFSKKQEILFLKKSFSNFSKKEQEKSSVSQTNSSFWFKKQKERKKLNKYFRSLGYGEKENLFFSMPGLSKQTKQKSSDFQKINGGSFFMKNQKKTFLNKTYGKNFQKWGFYWKKGFYKKIGYARSASAKKSLVSPEAYSNLLTCASASLFQPSLRAAGEQSRKNFSKNQKTPVSKNIEHYKISGDVFRDFLRLSWKSSWFQSNFQPYTKKIQQSFQTMQFVEAEKNLSNSSFSHFSNLKNFLFYDLHREADGNGIFSLLLRDKTISSQTSGVFTSQCQSQPFWGRTERFSSNGIKKAFLLEKSVVQKFSWYSNIRNSMNLNPVQKSFTNFHSFQTEKQTKIQNIPEYNRILYARISEVLRNFKFSENTSNDFFFKQLQVQRRKNEKIFSGSNNSFFTKSALFFEKFQVPSQPILPAFSVFSSLFNDSSIKPTGDIPTLRALWSFQKTNFFHFQETNSFRNLWTLKKRTDTFKALKGTKKIMAFFRKYNGFETLQTNFNQSLREKNIHFGPSSELAERAQQSVGGSTNQIFEKQNHFSPNFEKTAFLFHKKGEFFDQMNQFDTRTLKKFQNAEKKVSLFGIQSLKKNSKISLRYFKFHLSKLSQRKPPTSPELLLVPQRPLRSRSVQSETWEASERGKREVRRAEKKGIKGAAIASGNSFLIKNKNQQNSAKSSLNFWWAQKPYREFDFLGTSFFEPLAVSCAFPRESGTDVNSNPIPIGEGAYGSLKMWKEIQTKNTNQEKNKFLFDGFFFNSSAKQETKILSNFTFIFIGALFFQFALFSSFFKIPEIRSVFKFQFLICSKLWKSFFLIFFSLYNLLQKYTKNAFQIFQNSTYSLVEKKSFSFSPLEKGNFPFPYGDGVAPLPVGEGENTFFSSKKCISEIQFETYGFLSENYMYFTNENKKSYPLANNGKDFFSTKQDWFAKKFVFEFFPRLSLFSNKPKTLSNKVLKNKKAKTETFQNLNSSIFLKTIQKFSAALPAPAPSGKGAKQSKFQIVPNKSLSFIPSSQFSKNQKIYMSANKNLLSTEKNISFFTLSFLLFGKSILLLPYRMFKIVSNFSTKVFEIVENFFFAVYKFLEKPAEFMIEFIAFVFLIEWSSDIVSFLPDSVESSIWKSSQKLLRPVRIGTFALSFGIFSPLQKISFLGPFHILSSAGIFTSANFVAFVLQKRLFYFFEHSPSILFQPDIDILVRQKKGMLFWDIWAEILLKAAEKYNVNIPSFVTLKEEQEVFVEKLVRDSQFFQTFQSENFGSFVQKTNDSKNSSPFGFSDFLQHFVIQNSPSQFFDSSFVSTQNSLQSNQFLFDTQGKDFSASHQKNPQTQPFHLNLPAPNPALRSRSVRERESFEARKGWGGEKARVNWGSKNWFHNQKKLQQSVISNLFGLKTFENFSNIQNFTEKNSFKIQNFVYAQDSQAQKKNSQSLFPFFENIFSAQVSVRGQANEGKQANLVFSGNKKFGNFESFSSLKNINRWESNQYATFQSQETDFFLDIHLPKSLRHVHFLKYYEPAHFTLGSLICGIYAGVFPKQVSKNILVVGESGTAKTLFLQALAGETEMKIITENASRYAIVQRGVAVGMKFLRDVFDAIALQTPCFFVMEDLHIIGSKRPFLISENETGKGNLSSFGLEQQEVHETNQMIYQSSRHSISDFRRPYKGDFSMGIPTNFFLQTFYSSFLTSHRNVQKNSFGEIEKNSFFFSLPQHGLTQKGRVFQNTQFSGENFSSKIQNFLSSPFPIDSLDASGARTQAGAGTDQNQGMQERENSNFSMFASQKNVKKIQSCLQLSKEQIFAPPATSPFTVLMMKEQKKLKPKKRVQETSWGGLSVDQILSYQKESSSVRAKVAVLAEKTLNLSRGKFDMITDFLVIIDSVRSNRGFVVFGTTHKPSLLDPALRRPGRFDETLSLSVHPNFLNRFEIFKMNFENGVSTFDFLDSSLLTENFSEIDLFNLIAQTKLSFFHNYKYAIQNVSAKSENFDLLPHHQLRLAPQRGRGVKRKPFSSEASEAKTPVQAKLATSSSKKERLFSKISPINAFYTNFKSSFFEDFYTQKEFSDFVKKHKKEINSSNLLLNKAIPFHAKRKKNSVFRNSNLLRYSILPKGPSHVLSLAYSKIGVFLAESNLFINPTSFIPLSLDVSKNSFQGLNFQQFFANVFYDSRKEQNLQLAVFLSGKVSEFLVEKNSSISQSFSSPSLKLSSFGTSAFLSSNMNSSRSVLPPKGSQVNPATAPAPTGKGKSEGKASQPFSTGADVGFSAEEREMENFGLKNIFEKPSGLFVTKFVFFHFSFSLKQQKVFLTNLNQKSNIENDLQKFIFTKINSSARLVSQSSEEQKNVFVPFSSQDMLQQNFSWTAFGNDETWRSATPFLFSLVRKRFLFTKNLFLSKMLFFENANQRRQPPSPPGSSILMPAKKYENFKRTENDFFQKGRFSMNEKIQMHQKQRFLKQLYNVPTLQYFRSELRKNHRTFFSSSFQELAYLDSFAQTSSSSFFFQRKYVQTRHRFSHINQWWTGMFPEHTRESTFLSDVDWRTMFVSGKDSSLVEKTKNSSPLRGQNRSEKEKNTFEFLMDFPDCEQFYNPRNRRWFFKVNSSQLPSLVHIHNFAHGESNPQASYQTAQLTPLGKASQPNPYGVPSEAGDGDGEQSFPLQDREQKDSFTNATVWAMFEKDFQYEIFYHFLMESFYKSFSYFDKQREMLDFFVYYLLQKGVLKEFDFLTTFSRF